MMLTICRQALNERTNEWEAACFALPCLTTRVNYLNLCIAAAVVAAAHTSMNEVN